MTADLSPGKVCVSLYIDKDLLEKLDEARGLIPRNRLLNVIIEEYFEEYLRGNRWKSEKGY